MNKYIADSREVVIFVKVRGKQRTIQFHDMGKMAGISVFVTEDAELASALERHPRYNDLFYLAEGDLKKVSEPEEDKHVYNKVYSHVKRTQVAIEILVKEYGVKRSDIKLRADVLRKAFELNISFPNL